MTGADTQILSIVVAELRAVQATLTRMQMDSIEARGDLREHRANIEAAMDVIEEIADQTAATSKISSATYSTINKSISRLKIVGLVLGVVLLSLQHLTVGQVAMLIRRALSLGT